MTAASTTTGPRTDDATPDLVEALRRAGDRGRRRLRPGPGALLLRRLAVPRAAAGGGAAAARRRDGRRAGGVPRARRPADRRAGRAPRSPATRSAPGSSWTPAGTCRGCSTSTPKRGRRGVEPGVVQASLQAAARPHGLRFGPDPSTHNRCTVGGMIGNNACGSRALGYGRTSDNVVGARRRHRLGRAAGRSGRTAPATASSASCTRWSRASWPRSAPSSAASAGRCRATPSSTCCPSAASTSPAPWSAARARSRSCSARPCGWSPTPRSAGWSCSATRRCPRRPTPRPRCSPTARPPSRAWTPGWCSGCATSPPPSSPTCRAARRGWSSS